MRPLLGALALAACMTFGCDDSSSNSTMDLSVNHDMAVEHDMTATSGTGSCARARRLPRDVHDQCLRQRLHRLGQHEGSRRVRRAVRLRLHHLHRDARRRRHADLRQQHGHERRLHRLPPHRVGHFDLRGPARRLRQRHLIPSTQF